MLPVISALQKYTMLLMMQASVWIQSAEEPRRFFLLALFCQKNVSLKVLQNIITVFFSNPIYQFRPGLEGVLKTVRIVDKQGYSYQIINK